MNDRWVRNPPKDPPPRRKAPVACAGCQQDLGDNESHDCPRKNDPVSIPARVIPGARPVTGGISPEKTAVICMGCGQNVSNQDDHRCPGGHW